MPPTKPKTIPKSFIDRIKKWNAASVKLAKEAESIKKEAARRGISLTLNGRKK